MNILYTYLENLTSSTTFGRWKRELLQGWPCWRGIQWTSKITFKMSMCI